MDLGLPSKRLIAEEGQNMVRVGSKARAFLTILVIVSMVVILGGFAFVAGLIYPSRRLMNLFSYWFAETILLLSGVQLTVSGRPVSIDEPAFYLGNHQSALDIPILIRAFRGDVRFMAKDSLFRIPIFGWVIGRYGHVPIDRTNARRTLRRLHGMLTEIRKRPISLVAFPEGTRSRDGNLLPFRRGTMKIAQESGLRIVPFAIDGSFYVHHPERKLEVSPGPVMLHFGEPIDAKAASMMTAAQLKELTEADVTRMLKQPPAQSQAQSAECQTGHARAGASP